MKKEKWFIVILGAMMLLATVQGALAWNWFGLFPEKVIVPDVQFKSEPISRLDRLNNFFLNHNEFRSLPEGTAISLIVTNNEGNFLLTEKGIYQDQDGSDASIWVTQSFLERVLASNDLCDFFQQLKMNPEEGMSYGLIKHRNLFVLRWKYGSGDKYCPGSDLWP